MDAALRPASIPIPQNQGCGLPWERTHGATGWRAGNPNPVGALPIQMDNESGNVREALMFLFGKSEHYGADRASSILTGSTMKGQVCFFSSLHGSALPSCETSDGRIAPIDSLDQGSLTMIPRFMAAVLCVLGPLTCVAYGGNINGEATFVSFSVPGTVGTYPMSINASMTVTGYYYVTPSVARGFLREADATIITFNIPGAVLTIPEGINAHGDVTGFYTLPTGMAQGFLRYAAGRTVTFYPPAPAGDPPPSACRPYGSTAHKHQRL
jgi:hypothetical protein